MKKHFKFVNTENWLGLLEINAPSEFTPGGSITVAHDCIEHFPKDDGSVDREFMAFGAMYYLRHEIGNYFGSFTQYLKSVIWDFEEIHNYYLKGSTLKDPKILKKYPDFICEIANEVKNISLKSFKNPITDDFIEGLKFWMYEGYKKAKKRYHNPYFAFETFKYIESLVSKNFSKFEINDEVIIKWDPHYCRVSLTHVSRMGYKTIYT